MNEAFQVPANGLLDYVYYPVKVNLPEDKWISAIETRPGAAEVVHHIQVHEYRGRIFDKDLSPLEKFLHYGLSIEGGKLMGAYTPGNQDNARRYDRPPAGVESSSWAPAGMKLSAGFQPDLRVALHAEWESQTRPIQSCDQVCRQAAFSRAANALFLSQAGRLPYTRQRAAS